MRFRFWAALMWVVIGLVWLVIAWGCDHPVKAIASVGFAALCGRLAVINAGKWLQKFYAANP